MQIVECEVPIASLLDRRTVETAYFRDSYRTPIRFPNATVVDIFFGIFGHHPSWMNWALRIRNRIAAACGLDVPTKAELLDMQPKATYQVGNKIGPWPIFALTPNELVAGRNNKHLDFRLSILKEQHHEAASAVISTVCTVHNLAGKVYLFFIVPIHKWGVKRLIRRAIAAGRL
jgi:hypothetical protein